MYEIAVFLHILGGFVWVGGLIYVQSIWRQMILGERDDSARGIYDAINWSANRIIIPAALVVLIAGITMVATNDAWSFGQLWVILALVLFAVSAFGFGTGTDKLFARALELLDEEGISGAGYRAAANKLMIVTRIDGVVLMSIIALMVFKPVL